MNQVSANEIAALLIPTAVTLVTAFDEAGEACVATIAWAMPVSHEPSMMAVSIRPGGRTARAMAHSGCFAINVLPAESRATGIARICGQKSGVADRFAEARITAVPGARAKAPRVEQALSWVECELVERRLYGDHELFVGKTLCAETRGGVDERGKLVPEPVLLMGQRGVFGHFEED